DYSFFFFFFFSSRRRHTRWPRDWSSDVCSSDLLVDLRDPNLIPIHRKETVVSDLVYSANGQNVDTTIVDGEPLMVNRRYLKLDQDKIGEEVRSSIAQLIPQ